MQGAGKGSLQSEVTRLTSQAALSYTASPADNLTLSGTAWVLLDSLPTYDPTRVPPSRLDFSSRLLQLDLAWQILPGSLSLSLGKEIIHPSSGFFKTPLNLISRGAAGNVPQQTPAASPQWEEGWIGAKVQWIEGNISLEDFFSPRLQWSDHADDALQYLSLQQEDYQDQLRLDAHVGATDLQALALISSGGPGSADPTLRFQSGAGLDANIGDHLTIRAEATLRAPWIAGASSIPRTWPSRLSPCPGCPAASPALPGPSIPTSRSWRSIITTAWVSAAPTIPPCFRTRKTDSSSILPLLILRVSSEPSLRPGITASSAWPTILRIS